MSQWSFFSKISIVVAYILEEAHMLIESVLEVKSVKGNDQANVVEKVKSKHEGVYLV